jgi:molybdenum cofactor biosynthesis protein B
MSESTKKHKAEAPKRLKFGIFICSTSRYHQLKKRGKVEDVSGDLIESLLKNEGQTVLFRKVISDDSALIKRRGGKRLSYDYMGSATVLSRAIAGVAKGKAFFCIPGSPDAVKLCIEKLILPEAGHIVKHARE